MENAWEQRKFSDLVQIERGGSPRPIDDYIPNSPKGLNWVKIGDAQRKETISQKLLKKSFLKGYQKREKFIGLSMNDPNR